MKNDFAVLTINLKTNHAVQGTRGSGGGRNSADIPMSFLDKTRITLRGDGMPSVTMVQPFVA